MAITRCPYCHAIIDENDKYCNNCGTQLLFSEDEDVEEEIPGEKIINAETEEKDYTVDEPEGEKKPTDIIELAEELEEEIEEETEELALDKLVEQGTEEDDVTEEVILLEEIEAAEAANLAKREASKEKKQTAEIEKTEEDEEEEEEEEGEKKEPEEEEKVEKEETEKETSEPSTVLAQEIPSAEKTEEPLAVSQEEPVIEYLTDDKGRKEAEPDEEAVPQPVTFDTRELEGLGKTVELAKDKVDKFLEVLAEKRAEPKPPPKVAQEPSGTLPPWASTMKGAPVFSEEGSRPEAGEGTREETLPTAGDEEVEIFPRRRDSDSTVGLPERVSQSPLPFERVEAGEGEEEGEVAGKEPDREKIPLPPPSLREREAARPIREPERRPLEVEEMLEEPLPRPPFSFSVFLKSKAFDLLFVGLFWLVALWLAAHSMDMTLFEILGAMSGSMFLLYIVFAFIYFFLFRFFLGETLGDRLFRERE
jgi:hypothetical protein